MSHKRAQAALRESEARYALAARGTNDGLWDWDLRTDEVYYSPRWKAMLGYEDGEIGTSPEEWLRRVHPEDVASAPGASSPPTARGRTAHFECEHRLLHKDQTYRWVLARGVAVRDAGGTGLRMAGSLTDITEGKVADPLTGLPNRILFDGPDRARHRAVEAAPGVPVRRAVPGPRSVQGDQRQPRPPRRGPIADRLRAPAGGVPARDGHRRRSRRSSTPSRGWAATNSRSCSTASTDPTTPSAWPSGSTACWPSPFRLDGHEVFTTASIGIALGGPGYRRPEDLLRDADTAMYDAKGRGKARYEVFDAAMRARAVARLELETDLRRALERREFRLHYQPIVAHRDRPPDRFRGPAALAAPAARPHRPG